MSMMRFPLRASACLAVLLLMLPVRTAHANRSPSLAVSGAIAGDSSDTSVTVRTLLTQDLLRRFIATAQGLNTYFSAHKALDDSLLGHSAVYTMTMVLPMVGSQAIPIRLYDYVALAASAPAIAAIFKHSGLRPDQYNATRLTVVRAVFTPFVARALGTAIDDPASIAGKNAVLVQQYAAQLKPLGYDPQVILIRGMGGRPQPRPGTSSPTATTAHSVMTPCSHASHACPRVLFIGNSLTAGQGLAPDQAFPAQVERLAAAAHLPLLAINAGVSGATTTDVLTRIDSLVHLAPDIVVLEIGPNDGFAGVPIPTVQANIERIIDDVKRANPHGRVGLMQLAIPPGGDAAYFTAFFKMYPVIAREASVTLFPFLLQHVVFHPDLMQADAQHPNAAGESIVAHDVWAALQPLVQAYDQPSK